MLASRLLMLDLSAPALTHEERELLGSRLFGGVCLFGRNIEDRFQLAEYVAKIRALAGEDFIVAIDQEGGGVLRVLDVPYPPSAMALGAAADPELTRSVAAVTAQGLRALGINVNFAPVADVNVNPANPVIADRSFGSDPDAVARQVVAFVQGLQSAGVAATVKHFPGHGDTSLDSHLALPVLDRSLAELDALELVPFRAAVDAGVAAVMSAHIVFPALDAELPATLSPLLLKQLLRDNLGFQGVVFSDALDMKAITEHHGSVEATLLALEAGVDMPLNIGSPAEQRLIAESVNAALADGRLERERVATSLQRLVQLTRTYPGLEPDAAAAWRDGDRELLARAARESLASFGELPRLTAGDTVVLVSPRGVATSAASQAQVNPGADFALELERCGLQVQRVFFEPPLLEEPAGARQVLAEVQHVLDANPGCPLFFVSSKRTPLTPAELGFARDVQQLTPDAFLHVALWNPYHALQLPQPALLSFDFRPEALRAAAAALQGEAVSGQLPFEAEFSKL